MIDESEWSIRVDFYITVDENHNKVSIAPVCANVKNQYFAFGIVGLDDSEIVHLVKNNVKFRIFDLRYKSNPNFRYQRSEVIRLVCNKLNLTENKIEEKFIANCNFDNKHSLEGNEYHRPADDSIFIKDLNDDLKRKITPMAIAWSGFMKKFLERNN